MSNTEEVFKGADNSLANVSLEFLRPPERTDAVRQTDSLQETWENGAWEKAEWDGCPSLSLQAASVSQNAGHQESIHAKGMHQQEGVQGPLTKGCELGQRGQSTLRRTPAHFLNKTHPLYPQKEMLLQFF